MSADSAVPSRAPSERRTAGRDSPPPAFASASFRICFAGGVAMRLQEAKNTKRKTESVARAISFRQLLRAIVMQRCLNMIMRPLQSISLFIFCVLALMVDAAGLQPHAVA